jgi:hypothetical protein
MQACPVLQSIVSFLNTSTNDQYAIQAALSIFAAFLYNV